MKNLILCVIVLVSFTAVSNAQTTDTSKVKYRRPVNTGDITLGVTGGISSFVGDLNFGQNFTTLSSFRLNYGGQIEKRFGKLIGLSVNANLGKVSQNERSLARNVNFETSFSQVGLALTTHFDWYADVRVAPFLSVGFNYMTFNVKSDLKDDRGNSYYYWSDGKIRVLPQKDTLGDIIPYTSVPSETQRDYTYESSVTQSYDPGKIKDYATTCFVIPVTAGVKFKMAEFVEARFSASYNFLTTDFVDNYSNGINDAYLAANFSIHYTFGEAYVSPQEAVHKGVDFNSIAKEDADRDGKSDMNDECPNTPAGIEVDVRGCPLDDDHDGVANYLDKEAGSASGSIVNRDGITLSEAELKKLYELRESTYMEKVNKFYEQPSEETLRKIAEDLNKEIDLDVAPKPEAVSTVTTNSVAVANPSETTKLENSTSVTTVETVQKQTPSLNNTGVVSTKQEVVEKIKTEPARTVESTKTSEVPSSTSTEKKAETPVVKQTDAKKTEVPATQVNNQKAEPAGQKDLAQTQPKDDVKSAISDNKINKDGTITERVSSTSKVDQTKALPSQATTTNTTIAADTLTQATNAPAESVVEKVLVLPMPNNIRFADKNGDGILQPKEITSAIDEYLEGAIDVTVTDIMDMIDYFFSQQ